MNRYVIALLIFFALALPSVAQQTPIEEEWMAEPAHLSLLSEPLPLETVDPGSSKDEVVTLIIGAFVMALLGAIPAWIAARVFSTRNKQMEVYQSWDTPTVSYPHAAALVLISLDIDVSATICEGFSEELHVHFRRAVETLEPVAPEVRESCIELFSECLSICPEDFSLFCAGRPDLAGEVLGDWFMQELD